MNSKLKILCLSAVALFLLAEAGSGQVDKNAPPIRYDTCLPKDDIAKLVRALDKGDVRLQWDAERGWLPSVLKALDIPRSSQTLVFSKTSKQHRKIRPSSPRAIYFNDNVYVGFVHNGDFIEIAAVDPILGANFYTLDQLDRERPNITRATHQCMSCHETKNTRDVPGFLVRSVFPRKSGHPDFRLGTTRTDHTTPIQDRFGGWYVTGEHGEMRHRGNVFVDSHAKNGLDREAGANLNSLPKIARPKIHLEPTSDIVALMLLEHQTQFHNLVTKASYTARQALHHQAQMNKIFDRDAGYRSDTTQRRLKSAAEKLVEYLFFSGEFSLTSPVSGNSDFSTEFQRKGIRSSRGMSLRDLDLKTRLMKYPCSYLVYTESFNSLPESIMGIVKQRMLQILRDQDHGESFSHLSSTDRDNILEILTETHPHFKEQVR